MWVTGYWYLGKIEAHLFAIEITLVKFHSCLNSSHCVGEVNAYTPKAFEELEIYSYIELVKQCFKLVLKMTKIKIKK